VLAGSDRDKSGNGFDYSRNGFTFGDQLAPSASGDAARDNYESAAAAAADVTDEPTARLSTSELAELGLPVRVRQANLAPQLRNPPPAAQAPVGQSPMAQTPSAQTPMAQTPMAQPSAGPAGMPGPLPRRTSTIGSASGSTGRGWEHLTAPRPEPTESVSPEEARSTVSALQRGWQLGRSESANSEGESDAGESEARGSVAGQLPSKGNSADNADEQGTE